MDFDLAGYSVVVYHPRRKKDLTAVFPAKLPVRSMGELLVLILVLFVPFFAACSAHWQVRAVYSYGYSIASDRAKANV